MAEGNPRLHLVKENDPSGSVHPADTDSTDSRNPPQSPERREFVDYLFERYRSSLLRYISHLTSDREDAQEILQEAYIRILAVETLDMLEARARGYLFKIATNLVHDRTRRNLSHSHDRHVSINDLEDLEIVAQSPEPDQEAEWQESLKSIKQCLMEIKPRQRKVFILHCIERRTNREIARLLNVSTKTVERDLVLVLSLCQNKLMEWQ